MRPKVGLGYSEVAQRCKRILSNPGNPKAKENLINSLRNQCRIAEGEKSISELDKELCSTKPSSRCLTGAGNKQTGIGVGRKLGDGMWRYTGAGTWERI